MRRLIYSMGVSLDGYMAAPGGDIGWSAPDPELHRFHNEQAREAGTQLMGRRLYETMRAWDTVPDDPAASAEMLEFARIWRTTPKVVFSRTLEEVPRDVRLVRDRAAEEVAALKEQDGGDLAVGGAGLAATLVERGLVDEYRLFVSPIILGAGTRFFPPLDRPIDLDLVETRTFSSRVVYLRYRRSGGAD